MSLIGRTVGSVELRQLLGVGGMGEVYLGFDHKLERRIAVKTIRPEARLSDEAKARLVREARILSRLAHPGICQIHDLVDTPDGDFLMLEYVEGETLKELVRKAPSFTARLDLAEQIAAALAAAHRERIIHRDLKAENIMVTPGGGVKILDFGIARTVDVQTALGASAGELPAPPILDPAPSSAAGQTQSLLGEGIGGPGSDPQRRDTRVPLSAVATVEAALTSQGVLLGTLETMSPEQVLGEPLSAASDLYSLGIVLQELFTGTPAYRPGTPLELALQVMVADTLPPEGLDPDLGLLLTALKHRQPEMRPSAEETLRRLGWLREKPARLRRARWRLAAGIGLVTALLLGLATVSWFALAAQRARRLAEERREQAESLISFMLGDLRSKLEGLGRLELLDDVGDRALAYFETARTAALSSAEAGQRVEALGLIGRVRLAKGDAEGAGVAFGQALDFAATQATDEPANVLAQVRLATVRNWLGQLAFDRGAFAEALSTWRTSATDLEATSLNEGHPLVTQSLAASYHNVGTALQAMGDLDGALTAYQRTLSLQEETLAAQPDDATRATDHAATLAWVSRLLEQRGNLSEAQTTRERSVAITRRLAAAAPRDLVSQMEAAQVEGFLAGLLAARGQTETALALFEGGLVVARQSAEADRANAEWRRWRGAFAHNVARLRLARGETRRAAAAAEEALHELTELRQLDLNQPDWNRQLGVAHLRMAAVALAEHNLSRARRELEQAAALLIAPQGGDDSAGLALAAEVHLTRAALATAEGKPGEATAASRSALALLGPAAAASKDWQLLEPYARALLRLDQAEQAAPILRELDAQGVATPALQTARHLSSPD